MAEERMRSPLRGRESLRTLRAVISVLMCRKCYLIMQVAILVTAVGSMRVGPDQLSDRLLQSRRRQSQTTLLSHKQNLLTGSANSPITSPYNQFYLTNNINSPHNGKCASPEAERNLFLSS